MQQHNNDHPSIVQNIGGDQNQVVGGNIIHGDAHIHLHGDTHQHQPPGGQEATRLEKVESVILVCLCLASLSLSTLINFSSEQNIDKAEKWPGSQEPEDANYLTDLPKCDTSVTQDTVVETKSVPERISKEIDRSLRKTGKELRRWKKKW